jgi:DNA-binding CsgD family transcriptional regulator
MLLRPTPLAYNPADTAIAGDTKGNPNMARARDIAFIRKLCGLNVPAQALVQSLLPALRVLIPSHSAGVFWVDPQGEMASLYAERMLPPDAMARYYERHYQRTREGFASAFRDRAAAADPVSSHSFGKAEQQTEYFQDVMRPLDAYHAMYGVLTSARGAFAQISFYRGRNDRPFGRTDADTLRELLRYVSAALARQPGETNGHDASVAVEEQLGIVKADGTIASAPESWHRLLRLAALSEVSPRNARNEASTIESFLRQVIDDATRSQQKGGQWQLHRASSWGSFGLRAFRLPDARGRRADQIGLLIRREESQSVSLVRGTGLSDLSPQQREVAVLLAQGKTNREIAQEMGLTFNTASYHVKQVYARLEVNHRNAVSGRLLELARLAAVAV